MFLCFVVYIQKLAFKGQSLEKFFSRKKSFKKPSFDLHYLNFNVNETVFNLSEVVTYYVQHLVDKVKKKSTCFFYFSEVQSREWRQGL